MNGHAERTQQRILLKLVLYLGPQLAGEPVSPARFGEEFVSEELGACGAVVGVQTQRPLQGRGGGNIIVSTAFRRPKEPSLLLPVK